MNLVASDADGDEITFTATADSPAYELSQQCGVHAADSVVATNYFHNVRGQGEKYLQTTTSHGWLYILPNGEVYAWGGSLQASSHIGTLDSSYHADPSSLINATSSSESVTLTVDQEADTLTIDPVDGFTGEFQIRVTAASGTQSTTTTFKVFVREEGGENGGDSVGDSKDS